METSPSNSAGLVRIWPIAVAAVPFGLLMGVRGEFASVWSRALIAVIAGVIFGCGLIWSRTAKS